MLIATGERHVRHVHHTLAARISMVAIATLLATAIPAIAPLTPAAQAADACVGGWQRANLPTDLRYVVPLGVASLEGQPAWLVGIPVSKLNQQRPAIAQWVNGAWQTVVPPWSKYGGLTAVAASSATNAWAVGGLGGQTTKAISALWNGTSWAAVQAPLNVGQSATLTDLALLTAGRPWAVGAQLINGQTKPLALIRKVSKWAKKSPPIAQSAEGALSAVTVAPGGRVWTVGWRTVNGAVAPWILYRQGTTWVETAPAPIGAGSGLLGDIVFSSANDGWAVGSLEKQGGGYTPLLQHWDGVSWTNAALPWPSDASLVLRSAALDGAGRLIVAGAHIGNAHPSAALAVRTGDTWQVRDDVASPYPGSWMGTLAGLNNGALAAGNIDLEAASLLNCDVPVAPGAIKVPASPEAVVAVAGPTGDAHADPNAAAALGVNVVDRSSQYGLGMSTVTYGGVAADFNSDGWTDLFINRHLDGVPLLLRGSQAGFTDTGAPFAFHDRHDCAAADVDGDDTLDLFCSVGAGRGTRTSVKELLLGVGVTGGTVATQEFGLLDAFGRGRNAVFLNVNRDDYPDLFTTGEPARIDGMPSFDRLYLNVGGTHFAGAPGAGVDGSAGGACAVASDIDLDGDDDLLMCVTEPTTGLLSGARVYINNNGRFSERTTARGVIPMRDLDLAAADFDGDGRPDLAQLRGGALRVSLGGIERFEQVFEGSTRKAVSMAIGDVNGDGRPDIYVAQSYRDHVVFINDGTGHSFSRLDILDAGSSNTERVLALDYNHDGLTDFVILNGRFSAGPVKLISFEAPAP